MNFHECDKMVFLDDFYFFGFVFLG